MALRARTLAKQTVIEWRKPIERTSQSDQAEQRSIYTTAAQHLEIIVGWENDEHFRQGLSQMFNALLPSQLLCNPSREIPVAISAIRTRIGQLASDYANEGEPL